MVQICLLDGILTVKTNGRVGTLIDKPFLCQNSLGQHEAPHGIQIEQGRHQCTRNNIQTSHLTSIIVDIYIRQYK